MCSWLDQTSHDMKVWRIAAKVEAGRFHRKCGDTRKILGIRQRVLTLAILGQR